MNLFLHFPLLRDRGRRWRFSGLASFCGFASQPVRPTHPACPPPRLSTWPPPSHLPSLPPPPPSPPSPPPLSLSSASSTSPPPPAKPWPLSRRRERPGERERRRRQRKSGGTRRSTRDCSRSCMRTSSRLVRSPSSTRNGTLLLNPPETLTNRPASQETSLRPASMPSQREGEGGALSSRRSWRGSEKSWLNRGLPCQEWEVEGKKGVGG